MQIAVSLVDHFNFLFRETLLRRRWQLSLKSRQTNPFAYPIPNNFEYTSKETVALPIFIDNQENNYNAKVKRAGLHTGFITSFQITIRSDYLHTKRASCVPDRRCDCSPRNDEKFLGQCSFWSKRTYVPGAYQSDHLTRLAINKY